LLEGARGFVEDVAEEDVGFCGVDEADEDGADADGALGVGWVRGFVLLMWIYMYLCVTYSCEDDDFVF
jgi:hypothetical protein